MRTLDDQLDELVATFSDQVAGGQDPDPVSFLEQVPESARPGLERCLRMIRSGLAASAPRAVAGLGPGMTFDNYRLVREIGRGGMAVVFEAEQVDLQRRVAIKVLRPGLAFEGRHVDRFRREALAVAKLNHPHIVKVFGVGEAYGHPYIAMELVEGTTLASVIENLPQGSSRQWTALDLARAAGMPALAEGVDSYPAALARLLAPVARGLGVAHELGLVHRDIKPSNILLHRDGRAVLADFGLAKGDGDPGLSLSGEPLGTPYYMSPEQAAIVERPVDHRSDVYSFGVTLYEALTGRHPFPGETLLQVIDAIRATVPPSTRRVGCATPDLDAVVRRAMAREPEDRYPASLELAAELGAVAEGRPTQARAAEGGARGRIVAIFRSVFLYSMYLQGGEYRSAITFLGLPLVHVNFNNGRRMPGSRLRRAKGWIAVGELATGVIAFGPMAFGLFSWGGLSGGLLAFGGISTGVFTFGGMTAGVAACGGMALGYGAVGGMVFGMHSLGGMPGGPDAVQTIEKMSESGRAFFDVFFPWI